MASIASIIKAKKGKAGHWEVFRVIEDDDAEVCQLYHYSTLMLQWRLIDPKDSNYLEYNDGWGSVSDQNGLNTAFKILGIPLYFARSIKDYGFHATDPENAKVLANLYA